MFTRILTAALGGALLLGVGSSAQAALLVHAYEFANAGGATAQDLVGSANGTLTGNAAIAGGVLNLDGSGDSVTFGSQLIPFGSDFSVFVRTTIPQPVNGISEIIAQGSSGGPGFYIGNYGNVYRLTDTYYATSVPFHVDDAFHNLLLTNGGGAFKFSIDGVQVFSAAQVTFGGGFNTVIGDQFSSGYGEFFNGSIAPVKIYSGVATYAEATASGAPEPAAWALMISGFGLAGAMLRRRRAAIACAAPYPFAL